MKHEEIEELLSSYIDKELAPGDAELVEVHLLDCVRCTETLARLTEVASLIGETPRMTMPDEAAQRLTAVIESKLPDARPEPAPRPEARWRQWLLRPAFLSAAASVAVVAFAVILWRSPGQQPLLFGGTRALRRSAPEAERQLEALQAPAAPGVSGNRKKSGDSAKSSGDAARTFTRKQLDELARADETALFGGITADKALNDSANKPSIDLAGPAAPYDTKTLLGNPAVKAAVRLAARNRPATLLSAAQGIFEGRLAWIVVVELKENGRHIAGAVDAADGRLLYRTAP